MSELAPGAIGAAPPGRKRTIPWTDTAFDIPGLTCKFWPKKHSFVRVLREEEHNGDKYVLVYTVSGFHSWFRSRVCPYVRFVERSPTEPPVPRHIQQGIGVRVDNEVGEYVRRTIVGMKEEGGDEKLGVGALEEGMHPYSVQLVDTLFGEMELRPLASQLPVINPNTSVGTRVDLCASDREGRRVLVEIKTGYEGEGYEPLPSDKRMHFPYLHLRSCTMHAHMFQIAWAASVMTMGYNIRIDRALVVLSNSRGIHVVDAFDGDLFPRPLLYHMWDPGSSMREVYQRECLSQERRSASPHLAMKDVSSTVPANVKTQWVPVSELE